MKVSYKKLKNLGYKGWGNPVFLKYDLKQICDNELELQTKYNWLGQLVNGIMLVPNILYIGICECINVKYFQYTHKDNINSSHVKYKDYQALLKREVKK